MLSIYEATEMFKNADVISVTEAKENDKGMYIGINSCPLVSQKLNVLTIDDCKDFALYYLMKDPESDKIILITFGDIALGKDHEVYYPMDVIDFCILNKIHVDLLSYTIICRVYAIWKYKCDEDYYIANCIGANGGSSFLDIDEHTDIIGRDFCALDIDATCEAYDTSTLKILVMNGYANIMLHKPSDDIVFKYYIDFDI